jgi:hypothetical protein
VAKQDVAVELFYNSQWNDHAADVLTRDEIAIVRGTQDETQQPAPTTAALTFSGWRFSPSNPTSDLSGKIGRNTPLRILTGDAVFVLEDFEDDTLSVDTSSGGDAAWFRTSSQAHRGSWSLRSGDIDDEETSDVIVDVPSGATSLSFWYRVSTEEDFDFLTVIVDSSTELSVSGEVDWTQATLDVTGASTVTFRYEKDVFIADGDDAVYIDDLQFTANVSLIRFSGEVSSWTPRQSLGGDVTTPDRWVEVTAAGITRRLGQGVDPLRPALQRAAPMNSEVLAYWPLTENSAESPNQVPSPIAGVDPLRVRQINAVTPLAHAVTWNADTTGPGLGPMPAVTSTEAGVGFTGRVPSTSTRYGWSFWARGDTDDSGGSSVTMWADADDGADLVSWVIWVQWSGPAAGTPEILIIVEGRVNGSLEVSLTNTGVIPYTDEWANFAAIVEQDGSSVDLTMLMNGAEVTMSVDSGSLSGLDVGTAKQVRPTATLNSGRSTSIGHPTFLGGSVAAMTTAVQDLYVAGRGHVGEHAGRRVERLANEQGLTLDSSGDLDNTVPTGPQQSDGLVELFRESADVDDAVFTDSRSDAAVYYRTGRSRYNQEPALELDYANGEVAPPLDPVTDDESVRNDVTVQRRDGGQARAVDQSGPLGVDTIGRYDTQQTLNCMSDADAGNQAGWRLHLGTVDETRFPQITVDLDANPELADAASAVDVADRITIDNLPAELSPDLANLLVLGYTERIGSHRRRITFNCAPERPYHIAEVEHADYAVVGSSSATLDDTGGLTTTETEVTIHCGAGPDWTHEEDFDIVMGGERMTVTAVGSASGTFPNRLQQLTVVRSVNGVVKTHDNGTAVRLFHESYIGL